MNLLKLFQRSKREPIDTATAVPNQSNTHRVNKKSADVTRASSKKSRASSKHSSKSKNKTSSSERPEKVSKAIPESINKEPHTPNEKVVVAFVDAWNRQTPPEETLSYFASKEAPIQLEDGKSLNAAIFCVEREKCYRSFPDLQFKYDTIKEEKYGLVVLDELIVSGTHTGPAWGFGPFPPVPTTHKHVTNDPERLYFTIQDGKVGKIEVYSLGDASGPPGLYVQIGGKMVMPRKPKKKAPSDDMSSFDTPTEEEATKIEEPVEQQVPVEKVQTPIEQAPQPLDA